MHVSAVAKKTADSLNWHLQRSTQVSREMAEKRLEDVMVHTEGKTPDEIAKEVISQWGILRQMSGR
jgi:hypothetical protein